MSANDNAPRRVGYADAAKFLGIKVSTLRSMVHRRQVPHIRLGPQLVVFDLEELGRFLQECSVAATAPA
jgi:excisionase family DNA binding protein